MENLLERYALYVHFYLQTGDIAHLQKADSIKAQILAQTGSTAS